MINNYVFKGAERIQTPALIVYEDIARSNISTMTEVADVRFLWPHVKSHKMGELIEIQQEYGISRFKCATINEARLAAACSAKDVLIAYPLVGPNILEMCNMQEMYPRTIFYTIADNVEQISRLAYAAKRSVNLLIDINPGMDRTGVDWDSAEDLFCKASNMPGINVRGFHCYDGHLKIPDPVQRREEVYIIDKFMNELIAAINKKGYNADVVVMGGSPTYAFHGECTTYFLSPGTTILFDYGYQSLFPDLPYAPAAVVLSRVVSHPANDLFTIDLGYKSISPDRGEMCGKVLGVDCETVHQNEELCVLRMKSSEPSLRPKIGSLLYVIPAHICTTCMLYPFAYVVKDQSIQDRWVVAARDH